MNIVLYAEGCTAPDKGRLLEDYLNGELTEAQAASFEEHYFGCSACLEAIRVRQSGVHALARLSRAAPARMRLWWGVVAAALVIGATLYVVRRNGSPILSGRSSAASLAELSHAEPPKYAPTIAGGSDDEPRRLFVEAMRYYSAGDVDRAVAGLETSWRGDSARPETGFYLGAAFLVTNRVDRAIEALRTTVTLGESPFLERSKVLLAKAYLRREAIDEARRELREVVEGGGELRGEAARLLEGIELVAAGKR